MEALLKEVLADDELPDYLLQGDIAVLYKKKERADPVTTDRSPYYKEHTKFSHAS